MAEFVNGFLSLSLGSHTLLPSCLLHWLVPDGMPGKALVWDRRTQRLPPTTPRSCRNGRSLLCLVGSFSNKPTGASPPAWPPSLSTFTGRAQAHPGWWRAWVPSHSSRRRVALGARCNRPSWRCRHSALARFSLPTPRHGGSHSCHLSATFCRRLYWRNAAHGSSSDFSSGNCTYRGLVRTYGTWGARRYLSACSSIGRHGGVRPGDGDGYCYS